MNIGMPSKIINALGSMEPKQLNKAVSAMQKEQKGSSDASSIIKKMNGSFKELESMLSEIAGGFTQATKAAQAKAKPTKEDIEKMKKDAAKMMDALQATRIKMLEAKIAEAEKDLAQLRKWLDAAKKSKPSNWFM